MGKILPSICPEPTCVVICEPPSERCDDHPAPRRPSSQRRGYGRAWRIVRALQLNAHPKCARCGAVATDVDHIIPKSAGGTNKWANLQSLCHSCHSSKTVTQDGGFGR